MYLQGIFYDGAIVYYSRLTKGAMPRPKKYTEPIVLRLTPEMKRHLDLLAQRNSLSRVDYIRMMIAEHLYQDRTSKR